MDESKIISFAEPFYKKKDPMHNLSHINRIKKLSLQFAVKYPEADKEIIILACYMHGIIHIDETAVKSFLGKYYPEKAEKIITVAWESQRNKTAKSTEGKIVHDAHVLEGGKTFFIVKSLISGTHTGESFHETIEYIEKNIIGQNIVYLRESQVLLEEKERFALDFINDLKLHL